MQEKWYKVLRANIDPRTADKRPHRHYSHLNLYCICITLWAGGNSSCYNCLHDLRESSEVILTETEVQEDSAQEKKKSSESFSSEGTRRWHETSEQLWPWLLRCLCRLMQSRWRRRRHQASPHSILESDGQVSVRVIKAGGTTEGILNIKHFTIFRHWKVTFTVQSLYFTTSAPQSPSLPPIYKHSFSAFSTYFCPNHA